ncbi:DALR anticodon-binding domain-containing protein [Nocardiopsis sp. EMB25]|uniref:DALR anticodon-binding domain-containing protein n=1 Tax=Nocardiopsis sp. EMB25 TaxID=2835867 RepID=UPI002284EEE1|nr:DALR anticodon-binding domain-containing protein [Nocardiopsis sp. EMB25]MCY9782273.1 DALR anticodon-binding domain-containing protein [Nocardiopsis sp. EMB25]
MTPWTLETALRRAAVRAFGLAPDAVPLVWPRNDHADEGADAASALPLRLMRLVDDGARRSRPLTVAGRVAAQLPLMRDEGLVDFARTFTDARGFVNVVFTHEQSRDLLAAAADGPRFLTGRAWDGAGEWPDTPLHDAVPVAQARRLARADARKRLTLAVGGEPPPPGPGDAEVSWRDPYLDGGSAEPITPAARVLGTIGEASARVAFCRSIPERPKEAETTGRDLPVLPSADRPGAWARLTDANPAFRLRYAHAHALSRARWAREGAPPLAGCPRHAARVRGLLFDGASSVDTAARREEPHILVRYLEALASAYDEWRTCPTADPEGAEGAAADPALPAAVAGVLRTGLFLLGVSAPTRL